MTNTYTTPGGPVYTLYSSALEQPHLLIAGATGSGKSVVINGLIHTILHRLPGGHGGAQMVLIDPKRVELIQWARVPHTEDVPGSVSIAEAMELTEQRYRTMQAERVRKYTGPDLYVIIDEFADLMTTQARTVKPLIQRLAQIGRAARVHLIIGTQTPIAKILPTEIKCNFDSRIGLRARSRQDSRNIIDKPGLEKLPRYGFGVYMTPAGDQLYKIPMIPDNELNALQNWWERQVPKHRRRLFGKR